MNNTIIHPLTITPSRLIRLAGLAAMVAGLIFAGIQPIHPPDVVESVNTTAWAIITPLKTFMCLLMLLGIAGLYARQVKQTGWLGLIGYLMFSLSWALNLSFIFAETFIIPPLASISPEFVNGFFGIINGKPVDMNLGILPMLWGLVTVMYLLGSLLFGIAMFRTAILPRWASALFALAGPLAFTMVMLLPHQLERLAAVPMGIALIGLGYGLFAERRENTLETVSGMGNSQLNRT
jgi:hypothetical protein